MTLLASRSRYGNKLRGISVALFLQGKEGLNAVLVPIYHTRSLLRFCSKHVLDEAERSLHDALCVLTQTVKETRTVPGGGCTEVAMAAAIDAEVSK